MQPLIKGHNVQVGDRLREMVAKKTARLDRYLPAWAVIDAKLDLHEKQSRGGPLTLAEFTIATRGAILRAEAQAPTLAAALDEVVDRMARQIVRYRTRQRDRRRQPVGEPTLPELPAEAAALADEFDVDREAVVVRAKRFPAKPMDVAEAIEQLELVGHDFYVFVNQDDQQTNVVYRRREGGYGLLQPELG
jgi:putative sigma-54 modulation protein